MCNLTLILNLPSKITYWVKLCESNPSPHLGPFENFCTCEPLFFILPSLVSKSKNLL